MVFDPYREHLSELPERKPGRSCGAALADVSSVAPSAVSGVNHEHAQLFVAAGAVLGAGGDEDPWPSTRPAWTWLTSGVGE